MYKFEIVKKGYDCFQVENYISNEIENNKRVLADKNIRIQELLHQNEELKKQLTEYKAREANVNKALVTAIEKSQEMEQVAKNSYNMELERLKIWKNKWIAYVENLKDNYKINQAKGEVVGILSCLEQELLDSIKGGINLAFNNPQTEPEKQYNKEVDRIERKKEQENQEKTNSKQTEIEAEAEDNFDEIDKILSNPEFNNLIKSLGIA